MITSPVLGSGVLVNGGPTRLAPGIDGLELSVLGGATLSLRGRPLPIRSRKCLALVAYLALAQGRRETRERLCGLLWSESPEERARMSLRQALRELRAVLLEARLDGLAATKLDVRLDVDLRVDLLDVAFDAGRCVVHPSIVSTPRVVDTMLAGYEEIDQAFRGWLLAKRQTFQCRIVAALEAGLSTGVPPAEELVIARALLSLDPTHEEACRRVMTVCAARGDVSAALAAYRDLWQVLEDEYDMEPSALTQQVVANVKRGLLEPVGAVTTGGAPILAPVVSPAVQVRRVRLHVERFGMNGVDPGQEYKVAGFRHHLIASLVKFREWHVCDAGAPSAGSMAAPEGDYCVEATAYQVGDALNLVLTLRETGTASYVWSESFELALESWFERQRRLVRRLALSLNVQLTTERLMRAASEPDVTLEVYDRWLRGQGIIIGFRTGNWERASRIFSETIRDAPDFSPAYSSLVQVNNAVHIVQPGLFRDRDRALGTIEIARRAVQLDPVDSRAQLCLGWSYAMAGQHGAAATHMELAAELNDNDPWSMISCALFWAFSGDHDKASSLASRSFEAHPCPNPTHWAYLVSVRFLAGDFEGAIDAADRAQDAIKTMPAWRAAALAALGRKDEARRDAARFLAGARTAWSGCLPTDAQVGRWLLHLYPIRVAADWDSLRNGVVAAGIPSGGASFGDW